MAKRWGCAAIVLTAAAVAGCETATTVEHPAGFRILTAFEIDQVSAGSAVALSNANAFGIGLNPQTTAITNTLGSAGSPVRAQAFGNVLTLNYASSQAVAAAGAAPFAQANGSAEIFVVGGGGGALINAISSAAAIGGASGNAQINMQFYGLSIGKVDFVFGTADALACCAPSLSAQTAVDGTGGPYSRQLRAAPISTVPGQVESKVDISVVSSALPILDSGQVSALARPSLSSSLGR
jgi:hypothetical protein